MTDTTIEDTLRIGRLHAEGYCEWEARFVAERELDPKLAVGWPTDPDEKPLCPYSRRKEDAARQRMGLSFNLPWPGERR